MIKGVNTSGMMVPLINNLIEKRVTTVYQAVQTIQLVSPKGDARHKWVNVVFHTRGEEFPESQCITTGPKHFPGTQSQEVC